MTERTYRIERLTTGEAFEVKTTSRKAAHDIGQVNWPGELVMVTSENEHNDMILWWEESIRVLKNMERAKAEIPDQNYSRIVEFLREAKDRIEALIEHFANTLPHEPTGQSRIAQ